MIQRYTMAKFLTDKPSGTQLLCQSASGGSAIAAATFVAYRLHVPLATAGFMYLLVVVLASLAFGIWQATFLSLIAASCLNYFFIPPILSFAVTDNRDWIALVSFQLCALVVSRLSSRERNLARDANYQRFEMKKLYELSCGILLFDLHQAPARQLVQLVRQIFRVGDVAIFDAMNARLDHEGTWSPEEQQIAKVTYLVGRDVDERDIQITQRVIRIGTESLGGIVIRGDVDTLIANSIASLAATAFARYRSYEREARAESAQQAEQLRAAVLDALAHAFKTPLTAIRAASGGLLEMDSLGETETELATLIDEESVNLNNLCNRLLQTAKLETSCVIARDEPVIISRLVEEVLSVLSSTLKGHQVELSIEEQESPLRGDQELLKIILTQYLDNAAKYSAPETAIDITVRESKSELLLSVRNQGSLIEMQDRERVFERFYRSAEAKRNTPGTGLGLSIAKKAAEAHYGHVWVVSAKTEGTTFFFSMPKSRTGGQ